MIVNEKFISRLPAFFEKKNKKIQKRVAGDSKWPY